MICVGLNGVIKTVTISFDSPESRSESKHLVRAGESARGKGKENMSFEENDTHPPLEGYDLTTVNSI